MKHLPGRAGKPYRCITGSNVLFDDFVTLIDRLHRITQKRKVPLVTAHRSCHDVPNFLGT